jgi:hypothetical protein
LTTEYRLYAINVLEHTIQEYPTQKILQTTHYRASLQTPFRLKIIGPTTGTYTKDCLSSSAKTPSINLSYKKQQSSIASAEAAVPTQEYRPNHHPIGLDL